MNKNYFAPGAVYNDNHRDITINASSNVSEVLKAVMTENIDEQPAHETANPYSPPIPQERKYSQVREYIKERKKYDPEFKQFCDTHSLRDLCTKLTREFGWFVDENSLSQNLNRHM